MASVSARYSLHSPNMASSSKQAAADSEVAVKGKALILAAEAGNINEVTKLLGKKADINHVHIWTGNGKEYALTPLIAAVKGGHAEVVKFLINRKANVNLAEPCKEFTALQGAAMEGNVPMIELLISKGAKHDARNKEGYTPLHWSVACGQKEAAACLLDHGADINAIESQTGGTPLLLAVNRSSCHLEVVKLLVLKGADMKWEFHGLTALDWAALQGHKNVVDFLIKSGARFVESGTVAKDCKFCGKVDPVNMLRCLGCKSIHYCCAE